MEDWEDNGDDEGIYFEAILADEDEDENVGVTVCGLCRGNLCDAKSLACLHNFCCSCLQEYHKNQSRPEHTALDQADAYTFCPVCDRKCSLPNGGVAALSNQDTVTPPRGSRRESCESDGITWREVREYAKSREDEIVSLFTYRQQKLFDEITFQRESLLDSLDAYAYSLQDMAREHFLSQTSRALQTLSPLHELLHHPPTDIDLTHLHTLKSSCERTLGSLMDERLLYKPGKPPTAALWAHHLGFLAEPPSVTSHSLLSYIKKPMSALSNSHWGHFLIAISPAVVFALLIKLYFLILHVL